jgi:hypothetical protein
LRLAGALGRFWRTRGYLSEGAAWSARALAAGSAATASQRARALIAAGTLGRARGDIGNALRMLEEGVALARASGDDRLTADALIELGTTTHFASGVAGDASHGEAFWNEALVLCHA